MGKDVGCSDSARIIVACRVGIKVLSTTCEFQIGQSFIKTF